MSLDTFQLKIVGTAYRLAIAANDWAMICGRLKTTSLSAQNKDNEKQKSIRHLHTGHKL
jgi:hypothetical protein